MISNYMQIARLLSKNSKAERLKVGAVLVTVNDVILSGYNGTPTGWDNCCESNDVTKLEVIHAELNCIIKAAKEGISVKGATLYCTHNPCVSCSALIFQTGISKVVYENEYRSSEGIELLMEHGIIVSKYKE